jgi:hypothetical protein
MLDLAIQNLLTPMVLFFVLGLAAALARSDLSIPESIAKLLALPLLLSIGFRGGVEVSHHGLTSQLVLTISAGIILSLAMPFLAYAFSGSSLLCLRRTRQQLRLTTGRYPPSPSSPSLASSPILRSHTTVIWWWPRRP